MRMKVFSASCLFVVQLALTFPGINAIQPKQIAVDYNREVRNKVQTALNRMRARHSAPSLELRPDLDERAQKHAEKMVAVNWAHFYDSSEGEMWYFQTRNVNELDVDQMMEWYRREERAINYTNLYFNGKALDNFMTIVWLETKHLGVGVASKRRLDGMYRIYVSLMFDPRGFMGKYEDNVLPPTTPIPNTIPATDAVCKDTHPECPQWAELGECLVEVDYMLQHCQKSCGDCSGEKYRIFRQTPKLPSICWDVSPSCQLWSHLCDANRAYMHIYCNVTCGVCQPDTSPGCADQDRDCVKWANKGECLVAPDYMLPNCPKSCGDCSGEKYTLHQSSPKPAPVCWNVSPSCNSYADSCKDNPVYMNRYCNVTCGVCDKTALTKPKPTTITPSNDQCPPPLMEWARSSGPLLATVIGGIEAIPHEFPWQVAIFHFGDYRCGGTLIDTKHILSAAHCFKDFHPDPDYYEVHLGSHSMKKKENGEQRVTARRIIIHPQFDQPTPFSNDVAIVELKTPVVLSDTVKPVCLADDRFESAQRCEVTGWGDTDPDPKKKKLPDVLQKVTINMKSMTTCNGTSQYNGTLDSSMFCASAQGKDSCQVQYYADPKKKKLPDVLQKVTINMKSMTTCNGTSQYNGTLDSSMFCASAQGKDSCQGDSGGPLVCRNYRGQYLQYGIVSFGKVCAARDKPGVYASVSQLRQWIEENTK